MITAYICLFSILFLTLNLILIVAINAINAVVAINAIIAVVAIKAIKAVRRSRGLGARKSTFLTIYIAIFTYNV